MPEFKGNFKAALLKSTGAAHHAWFTALKLTTAQTVPVTPSPRLSLHAFLLRVLRLVPRVSRQSAPPPFVLRYDGYAGKYRLVNKEVFEVV